MVRKSSNINALRLTVLDLATCWQRINLAMLVGSVRRRCHLGARWAHSLVAAPRALGARASLKLFNNFNDAHGHPPV
jgi:hypothetical protein